MKSLPVINADVISRLQKGDHTAFKTIFDSYSHLIYAFSFRFLKEKEYCEEVVQETFLRLWENREKIDEKYPVGAYIYTVARRLALNKLREIASSRMHRERILQTISETHNETEEIVFAEDLERFTKDALVKLSGQQQLVFRLSRYDGLSHEEIADRLNISKNTVKNHMVEALKLLRAHFKQSNIIYLFFIYFFFYN